MLMPIGKDFSYAVPYEADFALFCEHVGDTSELSMGPPVVAVQERDDFSPAFWNARIECRGLPPILLAQQPHARLEPLHDFRRAIRRAVVHNDDFTFRRRKILLQHAHDRLLNEAFVVICVDQYADKTSWQFAAPGKISIAPLRQAIQIRPFE